MKMRRILLSLLMFCSLSALAMTDDQVIAYIKQQSAAGKTEQQIGKELLAKGVTPEQAERIKARFEAQQGSETAVTTQSVSSMNRERRHDSSNDVTVDKMDELDR